MEAQEGSPSTGGLFWERFRKKATWNEPEGYMGSGQVEYGGSDFGQSNR